MWIVANEHELYHFGIPRKSGRYPFGSGDRPFQGLGSSTRKKYINEDGSLTKEGEEQKKKYVTANTYNKAKNTYYNNKKNEADQATQIGRKTIDSSRAALRIIDRATRKETEAPDLSKMTNQELQQAVNRMNLEQSYLRLMNNGTAKSKGRQFVEDVLDTAGDALTIGGSAAAIYLTIKQLKG
jgi:hypothetical protein